METPDPLTGTVDAEGRLIVPAEVSEALGLLPGANVRLDREPNSVRIRRPVEQLAKVYVEPTSRCNLSCRTCMRNAWEEPPGDMSQATFDRLVEGLQAFDPVPGVFFGGFGEPLAHPGIVDMVRRAKGTGSPNVELITNACLLTPALSAQLAEAGLDRLWVSLDGIRPGSYSDVRLGALLPEVLANLRAFKQIRKSRYLAQLSAKERDRYGVGLAGAHDSRGFRRSRPQLGIAFVAMRRNIADLPEILRQGQRLGATRFLVSNVLPYTPELVPEMLYDELLGISPLPTLWDRSLRLPLMGLNEATRRPLWLSTTGQDWRLADADVSGVTRRCPFIEAGSTSVGWGGTVSPCLALLHSHVEYFKTQKRQIERHVAGDLAERGLAEIWAAPDYVALRRRVQDFEFSPCIACGGCNISATNEDDCLGSEFPCCGSCLWSHGLIRCP